MTAKKAAASAKKSDSAKGGGLRVVAPLVEVPIGSQVMQFGYGDILPDGVDPERLEHLKSLGFVESGDIAPAPEPTPAEPDGE